MENENQSQTLDYAAKVAENVIHKQTKEKVQTDLAVQRQSTELSNVTETLNRNNHAYTPMQATMMPEVLNPQMKLSPGSAKQVNTTISQAVVQATKQSTNSNQEEYQTVARSALVDKAQDVLLATSVGVNASVFQSYEQHKDTALAYAFDKGALAANDAMGQTLYKTLNNINPMMRYNTDYNLDTFREQAGHIYTETLRGADGKLHVTRSNPSGGYMEKSTGIDLSTKIGERKANDVLSDIGTFYERDRDLTNAVDVLQGQAVAGNTTTQSWETLVNGNFKALNEKYNFSDRYNKMLDESMFKDGKKYYVNDPHIRNFTGSEEDVNLLRNAVDASGNHLFTDEELAALDECVDACGYGSDSSLSMSMMNTSLIARRKLAKHSLDETQLTGLRTVTQAARVCGTTKMVADATTDLGRELIANSAEKKTNQLIAQIADKNTSKGKLEKAKKRLAKKKEKLGITTNEELLGKMRSRREAASEIKQRRRDIRTATSGMDRKQAQLVINDLKQQELLLRKGHGSKRLSKKSEKLQRQLQRRRALNAAVKRRAPHLVAAVGKIKGSKVARALGYVNNKIMVVRKAMMKLLKPLLIVLAAAMGVLFLIAMFAVPIVAAFLMFIEYNGNTDNSGKEKNDLQLVNEGMSEYESEQLNSLKDNIEAVVKANYPRRWEVDGHPDAWYSGTIKISKTKIKYNGKYYKILGRYDKPNGTKVPGGNYVKIDIDPSDDEKGDVYIDVADGSVDGGSKDGTVDVIPDYEVFDEFGDSAPICNCMQLVSLYRYYYIFQEDDPDSEANDSAFWINDFKYGRMTQGWNDTHRIDKNGNGDMGKWTDTLKYDALKDYIVGDLPDELVYHSSLSTCDNAGTYSYLVSDGEGGYYTVTVACCMGHVKATAHIEVDSKFETIIDKKRLKLADGTPITFDEDTMDTLTDYMGTYEDSYKQGYELYADFEVYFGTVGNMFTDVQIEELLAKIIENNGELNELQTAVITTALQGCGKFTYSMASHANCRKGVRGGATDCSGFVSWVHNNCGMYNNTNICNTTTTWSTAPGHKAMNASALKPGDIVIKGEPGAPSASTGASNHVIIYLGKIKNEKTGQMEDWIAECGGGGDGSWAHAATKFKNYKTWVPLGSSDTW